MVGFLTERKKRWGEENEAKEEKETKQGEYEQ